MTVTITPEAVQVVRRSLELAKLDASTAGVRLRYAGGDVRPQLANAPQPTDEIVESGGVRLFVDRRILDDAPDIEVGVSPEHETLVVRPV